jgi:hypothetical protein
MDGACARYLNYIKKYDKVPKALFINGNSTLNIRNGTAFTNEKNKQIIKAIFGEGNKNEMLLGKGVYKNYGIGRNGFNISSIQFALHYMFENSTILNEFLKNISECTLIDGYFIGCCYDGEKIFNLLQSKDVNTSISLFKDEKKMWEITKRYTNELFNDDETSIGYPIDVYQESINKTFREYLVNFKYLKRLMENYGFILLEPEDLKKLDLKSSLNNFEELYYNMIEDIKKNKKIEHNFGKAIDMSDEEKKISFMNTYFIFKKIRNVNHKEIQEYSQDKIIMDDETGLLDEEMIEQQQQEQEEEVSEQDKIDNDVQNIDDEIEKLNNLSIKEKATMIADEYMKEKEKEEKEKEKTVKEKTVKEKTVKEKTVKEKTVKEKTTKEKPVKEKTVKEKTVKEKPVKEKTVKEKTDKPKSTNKELTDEEILKIKDKIRKVKLESKD